ncbi:unnamed protein product [Jaminaea pallidilutea]
MGAFVLWTMVRVMKWRATMDDFEISKAGRLKHLDWLQLSQARSVTPPPRGTSLSHILASDRKATAKCTLGIVDVKLS